MIPLSGRFVHLGLHCNWNCASCNLTNGITSLVVLMQPAHSSGTRGFEVFLLPPSSFVMFSMHFTQNKPWVMGCVSLYMPFWIFLWYNFKLITKMWDLFQCHQRGVLMLSQVNDSFWYEILTSNMLITTEPQRETSKK